MGSGWQLAAWSLCTKSLERALTFLTITNSYKAYNKMTYKNHKYLGEGKQLSKKKYNKIKKVHYP